MANTISDVNERPSLLTLEITPGNKSVAVVKLALWVLAAGVMTGIYYQLGVLAFCAQLLNSTGSLNHGSAGVVTLVAIVCAPILYPVYQASDAIDTLRS